MESSLIEKFDKERYLVIQLVTIGSAIWLGSQILRDLISNRTIGLVFVFIELIGWIIFTVGLIKNFKLAMKINSNRLLKEALSNEMYRLYTYKSAFVGFWAVIITTGCLLGVSAFNDISALLVCKTILFFGCLAFFIATLVYNRD